MKTNEKYKTTHFTILKKGHRCKKTETQFGKKAPQKHNIKIENPTFWGPRTYPLRKTLECVFKTLTLFCLPGTVSQRTFRHGWDMFIICDEKK